MKNHISIASVSIPSQSVLKDLIEQSVKTSLPMAVRNRSLIVNDVPERLDVLIDENALGMIINGLLYAVVSNAKDTCIRVSAKETYGNMIEIFIKDDNSCHTYAVACNLQEIVPLAEEIGGDINITNHHQNVTTIAFRFPAENEKLKYLAA